MGYNPNEPRDANGQWTDAGTAIRKAASDLKRKTISNKYGLEINAQYIADKLAPEYHVGDVNLVNEVIATAKFDEASKNGMQLVKLYAKNTLVAAWFKGGKYNTLTDVRTMQGILNLEDGVSRLEKFF